MYWAPRRNAAMHFASEGGLDTDGGMFFVGGLGSGGICSVGGLCCGQLARVGSFSVSLAAFDFSMRHLCSQSQIDLFGSSSHMPAGSGKEESCTCTCVSAVDITRAPPRNYII